MTSNQKRTIFNWYAEELAMEPGITLNCEPPETRNSYCMITVVVDRNMGMPKEKLISLMAEKGVDCRPFFYPLSSLPAYSDLEKAKEARQRNNISYGISPYGINLPSGMNMTKDKIRYVCDLLKHILS